jgi:Mn2+/Fe2+ NRAMP family transporter
MGPWETAIENLYSFGFFSLLAGILVFTVVYYILVISLEKASKRSVKKHEKILFFIFAIFCASLIFIFSLGEAASIVVTYISIIFFLIVLFLLFMVLFVSFFGKPNNWKFWEIKSG